MNPSLVSKLDELGDAGLKQKFIDDFANASDDVRAAMNAKPELASMWKKVQDLPDAIRLNPKILDEVSTWSNDAIAILRQKVNQYPSLAAELTGKLKLGNLELDMIQYFKRFHDDDYIKYAMAGFSKRSSDPFGNLPQFRKMIDDTEIVVSDGTRYNFRDIDLNQSSSRFLGKVFDDVIETKIRNAWLSNDFSSFKPPIRSKLEYYKNNGFELVIQGKVNVGGRAPEPDLLFIPTNKIGDDIVRDYSNVEYPDIKYLWDVNFTSAQRKITSNLPANVLVKGNTTVIGSQVPIPASTPMIIKKVYKLAPSKNMELDLILQ